MSQIVHAILIIVTQRLFICSTSDKRGHTKKKNKKSPNGKRLSQKETILNRKEPWKANQNIPEKNDSQKRQKDAQHLDIFCISEKLLYMSIRVKTVDKNIRTFLLSYFPQMTYLQFPLNCKQSLLSSSILSTYFYQCVKSSFNILLETTKTALIFQFPSFKCNRKISLD